MLSEPRQPDAGGLFESTAAKPEPLRIFKHGKTISNCSITWESESGSTELGSLDSIGVNRKSRMSFANDARLDIRKTRRVRGAVTDSLFEPSQPHFNTPYPMASLTRTESDCDDTDITPKARKYSQKAKDIESYLQSQHSYHPISPFSCDATPSKPQARRFSLAKSFISKTIGRSGKGPKTTHRANLTYSKNSLNLGLSHHKARRGDSSKGTIDSIDTSDSFEMQNLSSTEIGNGSRACSFNTGPPSISERLSTPDLQLPLMLCPKITVTPEFESADNTCCSVWAGIEISGILQNVDGNTGPDIPKLITSSQGIPDYGRLYSMLIDLTPGEGCLIEELIGSLYESVSIKLGQTRLILVKVRLCNVSCSFPPVKTSPVALIAHLESHLGDIVTPYLNVKLTYKHSAFTAQSESTNETDMGILSQNTRIRTVATAVIKRHDPQSTWVPQSSRSFSSDPGENRLIRLVESYLPNEDAMEAIRRLSGENGQGGIGVTGSTALRVRFCKSRDTISTPPPCNTRSPLSESQFEEEEGSVPSTSVSSHTYYQRQTDPARRIWSEMRKASRGACGSPGGSRFNLEQDGGCLSPVATPSILSDDVENTPRMTNNKENKPLMTSAIREERHKIRQMALRNKRSIGADTLRSIAPSVVPQTNARKRSGGVVATKGLGGLGLNMGISSGKIWGLGMPWW
ncbi:hypothetical protein B7463_g10404, partial [Scytalidium lignicola]